MTTATELIQLLLDHSNPANTTASSTNLPQGPDIEVIIIGEGGEEHYEFTVEYNDSPTPAIIIEVN